MRPQAIPAIADIRALGQQRVVGIEGDLAGQAAANAVVRRTAAMMAPLSPPLARPPGPSPQRLRRTRHGRAPAGKAVPRVGPRLAATGFCTELHARPRKALRMQTAAGSWAMQTRPRVAPCLLCNRHRRPCPTLSAPMRHKNAPHVFPSNLHALRKLMGSPIWCQGHPGRAKPAHGLWLTIQTLA